ncbi:MAG: metallophosphoesterase [Clostridia bacterium]|nr:metallophosphoesterase [Clostridia bacterium]
MYLVYMLIAGWLFFIFCYLNNNLLTVSKYKVCINDINPFRIVQISDLHGKQFGRENRILFKRIKSLNPDIICITGDLLDSRGDNFKETLGFAAKLQELCPVVYIFGNHENRGVLKAAVRTVLSENGVPVLANDIFETDIKGNHLVFLGLNEGLGTEKSYYKKRRKGDFIYKDNSAYFHLMDNCSGMKIVLSHFPETFDTQYGYSYKYYNYDLQLSGHAHGGQFIFPLFGGVYAPGQGIRPRFYKGLYGSRPYLVVSRGLGSSSFPLRLFNPPDIVVVDVEKEKI